MVWTFNFMALNFLRLCFLLYPCFCGCWVTITILDTYIRTLFVCTYVYTLYVHTYVHSYALWEGELSAVSCICHTIHICASITPTTSSVMIAMSWAYQAAWCGFYYWGWPFEPPKPQQFVSQILSPMVCTYVWCIDKTLIGSSECGQLFPTIR